MKPAENWYGSVGPMLLLAAWGMAVVCTLAVIVSGLAFLWKRMTT